MTTALDETLLGGTTCRARAIGMVVLLIAFRAHRGDAQADTHPVRSPEKLGTVHFATPAGFARLFDRD